MNKTTALDNLSASLAFETGIDTGSATKVVQWLIREGVLEMPVVNETYDEGVRDSATIVGFPTTTETENNVAA